MYKSKEYVNINVLNENLSFKTKITKHWIKTYYIINIIYIVRLWAEVVSESLSKVAKQGLDIIPRQH